MPTPGIAVVNADPRLLEVLYALLTDAGYEVAIYRTDLDTYQHLRQAQPALIVLEVGVQSATAGWELLKLLRLDPQTTQIPILLTTLDHPFMWDTTAMLLAQGCDVLELPAGFEELYARVARLCPPTDSPPRQVGTD
jgi:DNA-binding response OmpR family regulator